MKKGRTVRIISFLLAVTMVFLMLPIGALTVMAEEAISLTEEPGKMLGFGFNAIEDADGKISNSDLIHRNWIDIDSDDTKVYVFGKQDGRGVLEQYGEATYATSSLEMMKSFGIDYTNTASANFTIKKVKAGVESKFGASFDLTNKKTTSELYYNYSYKAISNRYVLYSDYSNYLSNEFLAAVKNINAESPLSIKNFFDKYGTHMLTSFETGGEVQLTAWAYSESENTDILADLTTSVSANVGVGDIAGAKASKDLAVQFHSSNNSTDITSNVTYSTIGGENLFVNVTNPNELSLEEENLENWVNSLSTNPSLIPSSTEWIAVWEILPETEEYENVRNALYEYFLANTKSQNEEFLTRYCSFSNRVTIEGYTYISAGGNVYQNVPYEAINYVAPGSLISLNKEIDDSVFPLDSISYEVVGDNADEVKEVDRNGVIRIKDSLTNGQQLSVKIKTGDITIRTLTFEVKAEGDNLFSGGYGTESRPYIISTAADVLNLSTNNTIASDSKYHYLLVPEDNYGIDMSTVSSFTGIPTFSGTFDGNGYRIYGFNITHGVNILGFIHTNRGTVKNLTIGRPNDISVDGYSAKIYTNTNENISSSKYVGGIAGRNEANAVIDNCHVENVYIYGQLNDVKNNINSYCFAGGIVGTNDGIVTRCSSFNNIITTLMGAAVDSGDNNEAYTGGIAGGNYSKLEYTLASANKMHAEAHGDGTKNNKAYPRAFAGGIFGYAHSGTNVSFSGTYDNVFYTHATYSGTNTFGSAGYGGLGGVNDGEFEGSYTTQPQAIFGSGTSNGAVKLSTNEEFVEMFAKNNFFTVNADNELIINPASAIVAIPADSKLIVGDFLDLQNVVVYPVTEKNGNVLQEYNKEGNNFVNAYSNQFNIQGFSSDEAGAVTATLTGYGGYTADFIFEILPEEIVKIEMVKTPYKKSYYEGDSLNILGLSVNKIYNTGRVEEADVESLFVTGFDNAKIGVQDITVSLGEFSLKYAVSVYRVKPVSLTVDSVPNKVAYALGDEFDSTGLDLSLNYNNGTAKPLTDGFNFSGFDSQSEGTKEITVSYTYLDEDLGASASISTGFTVNVGTVSAVKVHTSPNKTEYYTSDGKLDLTGLSLELTYSNGVTKTVSSGFSTPYGYDLNKSGVQDVMISYNGIVTSFEINVTEVVLERIEISSLPKTQYFVGEHLTASGLCINRIYNDGTTAESWSGYTVKVDGYDEGVDPTFLTTGSKNVTVYYAEGSQRKSAQFEISIASVALEKIEIGQLPYKTKYKEGEQILTTGMVVNALFNNGHVEQITDYNMTYEFDTVGEKTVTVWYLGESASFEVEVVPPQKIIVSSQPNRIDYQVGDTLDLTGLEVVAVYYDGSTQKVDFEQISVSVADFEEVGIYPVVLTYNDFETSFSVIVNQMEIPSNSPRIIIDNAGAVAGQKLKVNISLFNNPGIASMKLNINYDTSILTLTNIDYNYEIGGQFQLPQQYGSPVVLNWFNGSANSEGDFTYATLTFEVSTDAVVGESTNIEVSYDSEDVYDISETNVTFYTEGGAVKIIDYIPGDINGDELVNNKDLTRLFQYLSNWEVEVNNSALDVNGDGEVNNKDLTRLFQYLSNWDVEIY